MRNTEGGFSFAELSVSILIIAVLAQAALPTAAVTSQRIREWELKACLREIRSALDAYFDVHGKYPPVLEDLVKKDSGGRKFLRRIPADPVTGQKDWFTVSTSDDSDDFIRVYSDNSDVFDVRSRSEEKSLEGTKYNEW